MTVPPAGAPVDQRLYNEAIAEIERLIRDRNLWKERHDRERAAHAKNLTEQQKCEAERDRLRAALERIGNANFVANEALGKENYF